MNIHEETGLIADAILVAADRLGNNNADTRMGAIEGHGKAIYDAAERIAEAIEYLADAISELRKSDNEPT